MVNKGTFYNSIVSKRNDQRELQACMENTVQKLSQHNSDYQHPGILLGKIQSGKTRAFLGVIALAFDNGYDLVVVLTKGTKALTEQTYQRLVYDFHEFLDVNAIQIYDIMHFPENLTKWELDQKLVIVAKKEKNNLARLIQAFEETYPDLKNKQLLIIDDEADFASVSFRKAGDSGDVEPGKISTAIDHLRGKVAGSDFLQVTATPYSLYLQPTAQEQLGELVFRPKRPKFTELVPIHKDYVGGDYYFGSSSDENSTAYYVFNAVSDDERSILKAPDGRRLNLEQVLTARSIEKLRLALVNFIVGGVIRRLQQTAAKQPADKYSFVVHTESGRASHTWQENIVRRLNAAFVSEARQSGQILNSLIRTAYEDLRRSVGVSGLIMPEYSILEQEVKKALLEEQVVIVKVNSDKDLEQILDTKGQLKLRTPLNIFIGGQILDRGITIRNLIGFYYGRNPQKFQQDTVLQHSRMYGARPPEDLAVTRFYTTAKIYSMMKKINEFDEALRKAFLEGAHDQGVYFIRKDIENKLVPCSPNKLLLSHITTLWPYKRLLPIGFQTGYKSRIKGAIQKIDEDVQRIKASSSESRGGFLIDLTKGTELLETVYGTLEFDDENEWDLKATIAAMDLTSRLADEDLKEKIWLVISSDKNLSRQKQDGRFSDDPDGGSGQTAREIARNLATNLPVLMLIKQAGEKNKGWRDQPFWWPVLLMPKNTPTSVFASETIDEDDPYLLQDI